MAIEILVPRLGWSMEEGTFTRWLKPDGASIAVGDAIYELEGDKAIQEVESLDAGILRIAADGPAPGDSVRVGQRIGYICSYDESLPSDAEPPAGPQPASDVPADPVIGPVTDSGPPAIEPAGTTRMVPGIRVSPRAARHALAANVDLRTVVGSGREGRIRERDVVAAGGTTPDSDGEPDVPRAGAIQRSVRHITARRMWEAARQTAPVTLTAQADATELVRLYQQLRAREDSIGSGTRGSWYTAMFVKLAATALAQHRPLLQQWTESGPTMPPTDSLHIAVAVHTEHGLFAPVISNVSTRSLLAIAKELSHLAALARSRGLTPLQLQGGHFTVTNLGGQRVNTFTPILNPPQAAILGIGQIAPAATPGPTGNVEWRHQVSLCLTFDHRIVDGWPAAAMLTTLCQCLETPGPHLLAE